MASSWINWGFSLIFSALLAREVAHRVRGADYRALGAAAYLGIGSIWALGLSSSAALIMAALREASVLFAALMGSLWLKERFGLPRLAGAVSVVLGIAALKL